MLHLNDSALTFSNLHHTEAMKKWLRPVRGAIGIGLTWGLAWFCAGMVLLLAIAVRGGEGADVPFPLLWGLLGFLTGATFSTILGIIEGHRRLDQMSLRRFAACGAVAGLLLSVGVVWAAAQQPSLILLLGPLFALSGAACAAGSLALARKAVPLESLSNGDSPTSGSVSNAEGQRLLGGRG